ncbi:hypothetical protein [Streptomyces sp. NPDC005760]|uniref:hypothetical protein n=1 Tax=Streptomyces sp. NPDC005760 TaxID=3156718 RepID=UPI0034111D88
MADTEQQSMRRALSREVAGTIGLLTDEHDFSVMRRYRSFTFREFESYLRQVEALLRSRADQGSHTSVALFDPEEYAEYCAQVGLDPDAPASRTRFTAELATTGPTLPYTGQPLAELVPDLIDEAARRATQEYASEHLSRIGPCASCGEDIGSASFARASELVLHIFNSAHPGDHYLVCHVVAEPETLVAVLRTVDDSQLDEREAPDLARVLAFGIATHSAGRVIMRTKAPGTSDRVYGWRLRGDGLQPLTAAEVYDADRTDTQVRPTAPESNVEYCEPPDLGEVALPSGHTH